MYARVCSPPAYSFCVGNGFCSDRSSLNPLSQFDYSNTSDSSISLVASSLVWVERASHESNLLRDVDRNGQPYTLTESEAGTGQAVGTLNSGVDITDTDAHESRCHACLNHAIRWSMRRAIRHMKYQCMTTTDASFRGWCAWVGRHPSRRELVRGMLFAGEQPYLHSIGWCTGVESCTQHEVREHLQSMPFTMIGIGTIRHQRIGDKKMNGGSEEKKTTNKRKRYW